MDNDLIKQQIESAKKAYISGVTKQQDEEFKAAPPSSAGVVTSLSRLEQQTAIMGRLKSLMEEAAQTPRRDTGRAADFPASAGSAQHHEGASQHKPFWAQPDTDIPPSERFAMRSHPQEVAMTTPPTQDEEQKPAPAEHSSLAQPQHYAQPSGAEQQTGGAEHDNSKPAAHDRHADDTASRQQALSAIRSEVISHMETQHTHAGDEALMERIEQLEGRVSKQQQDLTALLKLVRQLAARQKETTSAEPVELTQKKGGLFSKFLLLLIIMVVGAGAGLYFMNPQLFQQIAETGFNQLLNVAVELLSRFGLL